MALLNSVLFVAALLIYGLELPVWFYGVAVFLLFAGVAEERTKKS